MTKKPQARELSPEFRRKQCEAQVGVTTIKHRWRMSRKREEKFSSQCRNDVVYEVNGKLLCVRHAQSYALKLLLPLPDVCEDCCRNTKAPLFDGCMQPNYPRGYTPCL